MAETTTPQRASSRAFAHHAHRLVHTQASAGGHKRCIPEERRAITGAPSDIGQALAAALVAGGARVTIAGLDEVGPEVAVKEMDAPIPAWSPDDARIAYESDET